MPKIFMRGDHVEWNSEAGRVRGVIMKKVVSDIRIKGYVHHASRDEPQYLIQSDKTDHVAIHKGKALRQDRKSTRLNSSHPSISYAVFCLKKKKHQTADRRTGARTRAPSSGPASRAAR